ncbi:MAG: hypothetical protein ACRDON_11620 [Gaiellaceae bacterium]
MPRLLALGLIALWLSACGGGAGAPEDSGIRGRALLGPTCPVVTEDMPCPPEPYEAEIRVLAAGSSEVVATVQSGKDGRFEIRLEPGDYVLEGVSPPGAFPLAKPVDVTVRSHAFARATVAFDTGIRA